MVSMIVGYTVSAVSINFIIYWLIGRYQFELFLYWNISNFIYICLNVLLVFIINFQTYQCVSYCFLKCCYAESTTVVDPSNNAGIRSKDSQQNGQKRCQICKFWKNIWKNILQCIIGVFYSFVSLFLSIIIIVCMFIFCAKGKNKPEKLYRKSISEREARKSKKIESIEDSQIVIQAS